MFTVTDECMFIHKKCVIDGCEWMSSLISTLNSSFLIIIFLLHWSPRVSSEMKINDLKWSGILASRTFTVFLFSLPRTFYVCTLTSIWSIMYEKKYFFRLLRCVDDYYLVSIGILFTINVIIITAIIRTKR